MPGPPLDRILRVAPGEQRMRTSVIRIDGNGLSEQCDGLPVSFGCCAPDLRISRQDQFIASQADGRLASSTACESATPANSAVFELRGNDALLS